MIEKLYSRSIQHRIRRRRYLGAPVCMLLAAAVPASWGPGGPALQSLASKLNLTMGAGARDPTQLNDPQYAAIAVAQYGALEPGNSMKMYALEPSEGVYSFSSADSVVSF